MSFYALELVEQTPYGKSERIQKSWQDSHEITTDMYLWATEYLVNDGWEHYEVSNFAKPNYQGRMNQMVWNGSGYLGVELVLTLMTEKAGGGIYDLFTGI